MPLKSPKIDKRTYRDIIRQILGDPPNEGLRDHYTTEWTSRHSDDPGVVMAKLFARLMEIVIDRLNRVPDKSFISFLDMLGVERRPGNPARAPITFTLTQGSTSGGQVPAGTQVATVQTEEAAAITFETEQSMFVTPAKLKKIYSVYPDQDRFGNHEVLTDTTDSTAERIFSAESKSDLEHILYIGHDTLFEHKVPVNITINVTTAKNLDLQTEWRIEWSGYKAGKCEALTVVDASNQLLTAKDTRTIELQNVSGLEKKEIDGIETFWLQCRLTTPIPRGVELPEILDLGIEEVSSGESPKRNLDHAFYNNLRLAIDKDFYPFGTTPSFNDSFYFASEEVFSQKGQEIKINVALSGAVKVPQPDPPDRTLKLIWEYYHQENNEPGGWKSLGESSNEFETTSPPSKFVFSDGTRAFTHDSKSGSISFICPDQLAKSEINGVENYWIRARILQGNYGQPASYELKSPPDRIVVIPATYRPPSIEKFDLTYKISTRSKPVGHCLTYNNQDHVNHFKDKKLVTPFTAFKAIEDTEPALYIGIDKARAAFADKSISIYFAVSQKPTASDNRSRPEGEANSQSPESLIIIWEYWNRSKKWARLEVEDGTNNFTTRGTVSFIGPSDLDRTAKLGKVTELYWIRARLASGEYAVAPRLKGIYLNTTWTRNTETITDEIIGSSSGEKDQSFRLSRKPVLKAEKIYIKELDMPSEENRATLVKEEVHRILVEEGRKMTQAEKDDLTKIRKNELTGEEEIWVRWHWVENFLNSAPQSRHYVLDRIEGTISFGNDDNGMIPPTGKDNIKANYRAGGGSNANKVAGENEIRELKTSLPYIDKVFNVEAAAGGSDADTLDDAKDRGPQNLKHRDRAITTEDFVWLARQASTRVAKSKCLPITNKNLDLELGSITVMIVPESDDAQPQPTEELTQQVQNYLKDRALSTVADRIYVIGPGYKEVAVRAEVVPIFRDQASIIEGRIVKNLETFLHPLKGGPAGAGWVFGQNVYISEIYSVIEGTAGVDYVRSVTLNNDPSIEELPLDDNKLVFSGTHDIKMI